MGYNHSYILAHLKQNAMNNIIHVKKKTQG